MGRSPIARMDSRFECSLARRVCSRSCARLTVSRTSDVITGLARKSYAPISKALPARSITPSADITIIGVPGSLRATWGINSKSSSPGIVASHRTMSIGISPTRASAEAALSATATAKPACTKIISSFSRNVASSSIIRTRSVIATSFAAHETNRGIGS